MSVVPVEEQLLGYSSRLDQRSGSDIELVVIHCTELPDLATAREYGERLHHPISQTGNSGHFYIDRDGSIQQWVPLDRIAHHTRDLNARSIGIELVNLGRYPNWLDSARQEMKDPYPPLQVQALISLLALLRKTCPTLRWISGHEHLDRALVPATDNPEIEVYRRKDPGALFPWTEVLLATELEFTPSPPDCRGESLTRG